MSTFDSLLEGLDLQNICPYCGNQSLEEVYDIYPDERTFSLNTCCEMSHEWLMLELQHASRKTRKEWFRRQVDHQCRDLIDGATICWGLRVGEVKQKVAKEFVREHHRHNPPPAGWRWGHGAYNGDELIGVAMVGRPVARMIDHTKVVEVNRLCVMESWPAGLVWNACSMLYGAAVREAKKRGFHKIITYTLETEAGTTLKAAGFEVETKTAGGSWNVPSRPRKDKAPTCPKIRWAKVFKDAEDASKRSC